jgi:hypothetical protein
MSEELLVALIRERWRGIQGHASVLDRITELEKMLNTRRDPVSYDEAMVLAKIRDDWWAELKTLHANEGRMTANITADEREIEKLIPYNIPIKVSVDDMEWIVWKPSGGFVEVRGHERKPTTD